MKALLRKLLAIQEELANIKTLYREQDAIIDQLIEIGFKHGKVDNYIVTLKDNYADKNTAFKATAFRRYEISVEQG